MSQHRFNPASVCAAVFRRVGVALAVALMLASCGACNATVDKNTMSNDAEVVDADVAGGQKDGETSDAPGAPDVGAAGAAQDARSVDTARSEDVVKQTPKCVSFSDDTRTGTLAAESIDEASGLAASWVHEGLLWTHNDSGDSARVFLMRPDGALVAEVELEGVDEAIDWEDIAVAPCAAGSPESCVYVADTGDNLRARELVVIYRFSEPDLPEGHRRDLGEEQDAITLEIDDAHALWFDYPDGPRDVETLMVHPQSAQIYVVEKNKTPDAPVFRVPRQDSSVDDPGQAVEIATLHLADRTNFLAMITAGDIAPNGREFTVRTYAEAYTYCGPEAELERGAEDNFEDVFMLSPTRAVLPLLVQAESLAYDRGGDAVWITSEGVNAPVFKVERAE